MKSSFLACGHNKRIMSRLKFCIFRGLPSMLRLNGITHVLSLGLFTTFIGAGGASACALDDHISSKLVMGFNVYQGVLWTTTGPSGRSLGAYNGHHQPSLEYCMIDCAEDRGCYGMTYRPGASNGNTCLKFSRIDYETGETGRTFKVNHARSHQSAIIKRSNGTFCN